MKVTHDVKLESSLDKSKLSHQNEYVSRSIAPNKPEGRNSSRGDSPAGSNDVESNSEKPDQESNGEFLYLLLLLKFIGFF